MNNPDELERAVGSLAGLARDLERYDPWGGSRSRSDAADLRLILAANRKMREALENLAASDQNKSQAGTYAGPFNEGFSDGYNTACEEVAESARTALSTKED